MLCASWIQTDKTRMSAEDPSADASSEFATPFMGTSDTEADIARKQALFESMASDPALYDKLAQSLAPSIWCVRPPRPPTQPLRVLTAMLG